MDVAQKVWESRLRRMAHRQELKLERSPRRDQRARDYGRYRLVDPLRNRVVAGATQRAFEMTLQEVETYLGRGRG
jgi:hypothetical protein